jgi:hypothetical protein
MKFPLERGRFDGLQSTGRDNHYSAVYSAVECIIFYFFPSPWH